MTPEEANSVQIRVKGRWIAVPGVDVNGMKLIARGDWLKTAYVRGEDMAERELENPRLYVNRLRNDAKDVLKADIFAFTQKIPATQPKYPYPMEWDSVAAIHLVSGTPGSKCLAGCGRRSSVVLSSAKHPQYLLENKQIKILRSAQDDSPGDFYRSLLEMELATHSAKERP